MQNTTMVKKVSTVGSLERVGETVLNIFLTKKIRNLFFFGGWGGGGRIFFFINAHLFVVVLASV